MSQRARETLLQVLIDPTELALRTGGDSPPSLERALALLLDARFGDYQGLAGQAGWPRIGEPPGDGASPGDRLLSGISLQLGGASSAAELLSALARDRSSPVSIRVVAGVFSSVAFRDAGRPDLAVGALAGVPAGTRHEQSLVLLHLAVSQRELGDADAALASSLAAQKILGRSSPQSDVGQALAAIAARNASVFAFAAGRHDLVTRLTPRSQTLDRIVARSEQGLSSWLDQEFEGRLQDPSTNTMTFRQEDPVETPLIASLLRAEALGDWSLTHDARRRLGRYRLLSSVGVSERAPVPAMFLLRRAGDTKGLRQALRWYLAEGPLRAVREFGDAIALSPWSPVTLRTDLVAIAETADVMSQPGADAALARILVDLEPLLAGTRGSRIETEITDAVAALLPVASGGSAEVAARFFSLVSESSDPMLLQSVGRVFRMINWGVVDEGVVERWRQYAVDHLTGTDDHRFAAAELVRTLPDRPRLQLAALDAFGRQPDILTAITVLGLGRADASTARAIARIARDELRRTRDEAAKGAHGFGQFVDVPLLLTNLLMDHTEFAGWADLAGLLQDANVAASQKVGPLTEILRRPDSVPQFVHARVAAWASKPVRYSPLPLDAIDEFKGVVLRVRFRYRAKPVADLAAELLAMATSTEREARREAAATLIFAADLLPLTTVLTLGLTLSRDAAAEVRGTAARALPLVASLVEGPLGAAGWARVTELLRDESVQVQLSALRGLEDGPRKDVPTEVLDLVERLAANHVSRRVRISASRVAATIASIAAGAEPLPEPDSAAVRIPQAIPAD